MSKFYFVLQSLLQILFLSQLQSCVNPIYAQPTNPDQVFLDFSFDAFDLVLPQVTEGAPELDDCSQIKYNFEKYIKAEDLHWQNNYIYSEKLLNVLSVWQLRLSELKKNVYLVPAESFLPVLTLSENIRFISDVMDQNAQSLGDYMSTIKSFADSQCDFTDQFYFEVENYDEEGLSLNTSFTQYLRDMATELEDLYYHYQAFESKNLALSDLSSLDAFLRFYISSESGSAGFSEIMYLYKNAFETYFQEKRQKIIDNLN